MLTRALSILAFFGLLAFLPWAAEAFTASCLPGGLPSAPAPAVAGKEIVSGFGSSLDRYHIDVWRMPCQDGSGEVALLLRATPIAGPPFVCPVEFTLIQGGQQIDPIFRRTAGTDGDIFCSTLLVPTTVSLERFSGAAFDNTAAFTLDVDQGAAGHVALEVPALDPPTPKADFAAAVIGEPSLDWSIVATGNFNGDGRTDILWRHTSGLVGFWLMNGLVTIGADSFYPAAPVAIRGVGDFDGNGKADILWQTPAGLVGIWFMNGTAIAHTVTFDASGNIPAEWEVASVADVSGDGRADIVWRHTPSGSVGIWLMDIVLE